MQPNQPPIPQQQQMSTYPQMGPPAGAQPPPEGYAGQAPPPFVHPGTMPEPPQTQPLMQAQGYPPQPAQGYPPQPAQGYPPQPAQGYPQAEQVKQQHYPKGFHPGANGAPVPPGPGGPQVYAPPIMVMDPMTMLAQQERVYVKEKLRLIELLGIDAANKYVIRDTYKNNLFVAKETTGCCERNCIPPDCRPFNMEMYQAIPGAPPQTFLRAERPCQWTCCCLNRPKMEVMNTNTGQRMGFVTDPFACCKFTFKIHDANEQERLLIEGDCCQPGLCCKCPCGPCKEVQFPITDIATGLPVGKITKENSWKGVLLDDMADNFWVEFGHVQDPQWKALLVSAAIFMDFRLFNGADSQRNNENGAAVGGLIAASFR